MNGMSLRWGRGLAPSVGIVSLLALLALACFPVLAQAAGSAEIEYSDAPPPVNGSQSYGSGSSATSSGGGSKSSTKSGSSGGSKNGSSSKNGGASAKGTGGNRRQRIQGKGADGQSSAVGGSQLPGEEASSSSSPLLPILLAILALAAISIGIVLIRRRRERDASGTSVPSEASS